jgi:hypothetical protein
VVPYMVPCSRPARRYPTLRIEERIEELEANKSDVRFALLMRICQEHFGNSRQKGSHHIFKTPWPGDPRINLQEDERNKGKAKPYQVKQVIDALRKVLEMRESTAKGEAYHAKE